MQDKLRERLSIDAINMKAISNTTGIKYSRLWGFAFRNGKLSPDEMQLVNKELNRLSLKIKSK